MPLKVISSLNVDFNPQKYFDQTDLKVESSKFSSSKELVTNEIVVTQIEK